MCRKELLAGPPTADVIRLLYGDNLVITTAKCERKHLQAKGFAVLLERMFLEFCNIFKS